MSRLGRHNWPWFVLMFGFLRVSEWMAQVSLQLVGLMTHLVVLVSRLMTQIRLVTQILRVKSFLMMALVEPT